MASPSIPRFLLPRGHELLHPRTSRHLLSQAARRHASSSAASSIPKKPLVLEKPEKFNPPSHPARLVRKQQAPRNYPGPRLSEKEEQERKTRRYPHMFPDEGTVMYRVLTSRGLHLYISLSVLMTLAGFVFVQNFLHTTPPAYRDMLPAGREFFQHPFTWIKQVKDVYVLHTEYISAETAERRRRKVDDALKRREFRKAHGISETKGILGWAGLEEDEMKMKEGGGVGEEVGAVATGGEGVRAPLPIPAAERVAEAQDTYVDFEGRKRPIKKWLGIW